MLFLKSDQYVVEVVFLSPKAGGLGPTAAGSVVESV